MGSRRRGFEGAYWNNESVAGSATSAEIQVGRAADNFTVFIKTDGASTFVLQIAHAGDETGEGILPTKDEQTLEWHDLWYLGNTGVGNSTECKLTFSGAGSLAMIVPDFGSMYTRLRRTDAGAAVTVTAGFEIQGD